MSAHIYIIFKYIIYIDRQYTVYDVWMYIKCTDMLGASSSILYYSTRFKSYLLVESRIFGLCARCGMNFGILFIKHI